MVVNVVRDNYGWGIAKTFEVALLNYRKFNGNMRKGQKFEHCTFRAASLDDVLVDEFGYTRLHGAQLISQKLEEYTPDSLKCFSL